MSDKLIQYKDVKRIFDKKYKYRIDCDNPFSIPDAEYKQAQRALEILDLVGQYKALIPKDDIDRSFIYAKNVKDVKRDCLLENDPIKLPNIKRIVNPKHHNKKLSYVSLKNYLLRSAKVYGKMAYRSVMNNKLANNYQKQNMKKYPITKVDQSSYHMTSNTVNDALWEATFDAGLVKSGSVDFEGGLTVLPANIEDLIGKELLDVNLARGAMYDPSFAIHQRTIDNINNSKLLDPHGSASDVNFKKLKTSARHKLNSSEKHVYDHLMNDYERSTHPETNIDYSTNEQQYAKKIIKITNQMWDNSSDNKEEYYMAGSQIITKNDTKNWSKRDQKLFNDNQKLWNRLYYLGVAPIPEYTPGRVIKGNVNRIGHMSYIIKHVSEGDFTKRDIDEGMKIAKKRASVKAE